MGGYYRVAMGFLTLGFEMDLLLMATTITSGLRVGKEDEALLILAFISYSAAFLLGAFLNFGHLKDNPSLPFAVAVPAILAAVFIIVSLFIISSRDLKLLESEVFPISIFTVSLIYAICASVLLIIGRFKR